MKYLNFLETLTPKQKMKLKDKKGALLYYEWYSRLYDNLDLETIGAMLLGAVFYDMHAGSKSIPSKLMKIINKDKTAKVLFDALIERTHAGTMEWINRHNTRHRDCDIDDDGERCPDETVSSKATAVVEKTSSDSVNYEELNTDDDLPF